jgi:hypothetical protein
MPATDKGERGAMRWLRSNIRGFSRLALFALAVQITLTFGHVHLDGRAGGLAAASVQAAQLADQSATPLAKARGQDQKKSQGSADFDCPICALIQLASTSAPSVAPPLPIPALIGGFMLETPGQPGFTVSPPFAFQARGPPAI